MDAPTIFSPSQLTALVTSILPELPAGHTNAVVATVDTSGVKLIAGFSKDNNRWQFNGAFEHDWTGENKLGANLIYSF